MAMKVKVEIKNRERLNAKLAKMAKGMGSSGLERGINFASALVLSRAKPLTPIRTGNLRSSLHVKQAKTEGDNTIGGVSTNCEYAVYVEFGTGRMAKGTYPYPTKVPLVYSDKGYWHYFGKEDKKGNHFRTAVSKPAHPFLGRALHESERDIDQMVIRGVKQFLKESCSA